MAKAAVVLSGSGYLDGAEIQESVLSLYFLERAGITPRCFAPNREQRHVVNHLTQEVSTGERRNVLVEAARIARGQISDLARANLADVDALVLPGGFGVAKNLSDFAFEGAKAQVDPDLTRLVGEALAAKKPIVAICISPAVLAVVFAGQAVRAELTVGSADDPVAAAIEATGSQHRACTVGELVVDEKHRIISTPAYMLGPSPSAIGAGIEAAIAKLASWLR